MKKPQILKVHKDLSIPWFAQIEKTVKFPHRSESDIYYSIKPPDYVTALTRTTENKFIILRQYRPAIEEYTFELPSGHIEDGETPVEAVMREIREETGCAAKDVSLLGELIPDTGRLENRLWAFYIKGVEMRSLPKPHENDGIEVYLLTPDELFQMINNAKLNHALDLSVIALAILRGYLKL